MIQVFASVFQDEAVVVKSILESAGLEPQLLSDGMLDINPLFTVDIKGVQVWVGDDEAEDAQALVGDYLERKRSRDALAQGEALV